MIRLEIKDKTFLFPWAIFAILFISALILIQYSSAPAKSSVKNTTNDFIYASPTPQMKLYSLTEIQTHNSQDNCWIIIKNTVYNIPSSVNQFPSYCGKDNTDLFAKTLEQYPQYSALANQMLSKYVIGGVENKNAP